MLFRHYKFSSTSKWEGPFLKTLLGRGLDPWFFFNDILTVISSWFQKNVCFTTYRSQKCKFSWSCFYHVANNWGTRSWEETVIQSVRQPVNEVILQSIFRECVLGLEKQSQEKCLLILLFWSTRHRLSIFFWLIRLQKIT